MTARTTLVKPNVGPDANTPCNSPIQQCQKCNFDLKIKLLGSSDERILTPFSVPDYDGTTNQDYIKFELEVLENTVDTISMEVTVGKGATLKTIYSDTVPSNYYAPGQYEVTWDGFSNAGILDTKLLKDPDLTLKLTAELCGVKKEKTLQFNNKAEEKEWVDIVIDRNQKTIEVELRIEIGDGGANGVGELPPSGAQQLPSYKALTPGHPRTQPHTRIHSFTALQNLALQGIDKYWSRQQLPTLSGYALSVKSQVATSKSMDSIKVIYNTNNGAMRSSNPGPEIPFIPDQIVYNVGWLNFSNGWGYQTNTNADLTFEVTAAHEIGHDILSAYGGKGYSYKHKGSSSLFQNPTPGSKYPHSGEIDLMKYFDERNPPDFYSRVKASETDVKSLLWLSRVKFK